MVCTYIIKVHLFWEGHKNLHDHPYGFDNYLVNIKTIRKIAHIFVAFSEKLNFISSEFFPEHCLIFVLYKNQFCIQNLNFINLLDILPKTLIT